MVEHAVNVERAVMEREGIGSPGEKRVLVTWDLWESVIEDLFQKSFYR